MEQPAGGRAFRIGHRACDDVLRPVLPFHCDFCVVLPSATPSHDHHHMPAIWRTPEFCLRINVCISGCFSPHCSVACCLEDGWNCDRCVFPTRIRCSSLIQSDTSILRKHSQAFWTSGSSHSESLHGCRCGSCCAFPWHARHPRELGCWQARIATCPWDDVAIRWVNWIFVPSSNASLLLIWSHIICHTVARS